MPKSKETNYILLQNALLNMSEEDETKSTELLQSAGFNTDKLIIGSLAAIEKHRSTMENRLFVEEKEDLFDTVQNKIRDLLSKSPEKTVNFLTGYFKQHALPIQFGAKAGLSNKSLSKIKDKIDLNDLSRKLDDNDSR